MSQKCELLETAWRELYDIVCIAGGCSTGYLLFPQAMSQADMPEAWGLGVREGGGMILETRNLKKVYGQGETRVCALDGVNLKIKKGEFAAIVGTSGSGKSTLLHMMGGLDVPTAGEVFVDGRHLQDLDDEELTIFRRRNIGFVFQQYNLIPMLNVRDNILLPVKLDGRKADEAYISQIIETLGLQEKLDQMPLTLSGGQQQRVAIARALAVKPAILLADEPTGNLDSRTSQDVLGLLKVTGKYFCQTMVMITHNEEIAQLADCVYRLEDGKIVTRSVPDKEG